MTALDTHVAPGDVLRGAQGALAVALVDRQFEADPDLARRYGPIGREKCLQDANHHLSFLADAIDAGDPVLFISYVAWAKVMLGARGIPPEDLARHLENTRAVIAGRLAGPAGVLAQEYLERALSGLADLPLDTASCLLPDTSQTVLARAYLEALLAGERRKASTMILDAVGAGTPVKDVYLQVFQPVQHEVGRLWQVNQISVAQEHYCTAATQLVMSQLYPHIFAAQHKAGTLIATCVAGDLHEIGVRMVADFFEMDGWNTFYLGASTPAAAVVDAIVQRGADVLAISATISGHLKQVAELIARVRSSPACQSTKILVGGHPFTVMPDLWRKIGADGCASDAQAAITLANRLLASDAD